MKLSFKHISLALCANVLLFSCTKDDEVKVAAGEIPATVQEHWFDYSSILKYSYRDDQIITYLNADMDTTLKWYNPVASKIWKYVKQTYGDFGADTRLRLYLHEGQYLSGGGFFATLTTYMERTCDYKNTVIVSSTMWEDSDIMTAVLTHEMSHIVEGSSLHIKYSPSAKLWGDSKFQDIFIYDVYVSLGMNELAEKFYTEYLTNYANYPQEKTYWFRDWWYPIYTKYGKTALLQKYFKLLSENLHHEKNGEGFEEYTEDVNLGEFVHFMSGAAGKDLKDQATTAFGWTMENEQQLLNAKSDYPNVKY